MCLFLGIYSYICDITTDGERSRRLALVDSLFPIGVYTGMELSTHLIGSVGIAGTFVFSMAFIAAAMVYNVAFVKDSRILRQKRLEKMGAPPSPSAAEEEEERSDLKSSNGRGLRALLNPKNVVDGVRATFMKRPSNDRAKILLLIGTFLLDVLAMMGRHSVLFLFFRMQFHWSHADYSTYLTAFGVTGVAGQIVAIPFLSSKLGWSDTTILAVTTSTSVANQIIIALSTAEWSVYMGAGIACLGNATSVMCRSQITKLIGPLETGRVFAFMGALQALAPLVGREGQTRSRIFRFLVILDPNPVKIRILTPYRGVMNL